MDVMIYIDLMDECVYKAKDENRALTEEDILFMNGLVNLAVVDRNISEEDLKCIENTLHMWEKERLGDQIEAFFQS